MYSWIFNSFTYWFIPYLLIESHSQQVFSRHWNKAVNKKDHGAHILVGNIVSNTSNSVQFSSVQLLSHVRLFATPWIAARQASLSITNSWSSLKLMSIKSVCHPAISSSVIHFSSCPQSLPASGSFPMSQLLAWGGQSIGVSVLASVRHFRKAFIIRFIFYTLFWSLFFLINNNPFPYIPFFFYLWQQLNISL